MPAFAEVDWVSKDAGEVSIDRRKVVFSRLAEKALGKIADEVSKVVRSISLEARPSQFAWLNDRVADRALPDTTPCWLSRKEGADTWSEIRFPAVASLTFIYLRIRRLEWLGQEVTVVPSLQGHDADGHYQGLAFVLPTTPPDRVVVVQDYSLHVAALWEKKPEQACFTHQQFAKSQFPPNWIDLCGVGFDRYSGTPGTMPIWNSGHPLVGALSEQAWRWMGSHQLPDVDPLSIKDRILSDHSYAATWTLFCLAVGFTKICLGACERDKTFTRELWKRLHEVMGRNGAIMYFVQSVPHSQLHLFSSGTLETKISVRPKGVLPEASPEWTLESPVIRSSPDLGSKETP
jgi:hypothetical protein